MGRSSTAVLWLAAMHACVARSWDCENLWRCDAEPVPQTYKHFPGACGPRAPGLRLGMGSVWPRRCVREFVSLLFDDCGAAGGAAASRDCVNLAPAGSGTTTLVRAMQAAGYGKCGRANASCWHHQHTGLGVVEALARAPCVIVTSREPAARVESGHHYRRHEASVADALGAVATRYENHTVLKPSFGYFGTPTAAYFAGLTRGACRGKRVHVLCTEHLGAELAALGDEIGAPGLAVDTVANVRVAARGSSLPDAWRHWLNLEVYGLDAIIHDRACRAYARYRPRLAFPPAVNATTKGALAYHHLREG